MLETIVWYILQIILVDLFFLWSGFLLIVFLCFAPFKGGLKIPPLKIAGVMFLIAAAWFINVVAADFIAQAVSGEDYEFDDVLLYSYGSAVLALVLVFLYYCKAVDDGINKLLFIFFAAAHISRLIDAPLIMLQYFGADMESIPLRLIYIAAAAVAAYVYYRFFVPRLRNINARNMKYLWIIPLLLLLSSEFMSEVTVYSEEFAEYYAYFIYAAGSAVIYLLLIYTLSGIEKNIRLEYETLAANKLLALQREQYAAMAKNEEELAAGRHDLRHQLAVIKEFAVSDETVKLRAYLDELTGNPPPSVKDAIICENYAVNAVARHYLSIAEGEGVKTEARLVIPQDTGRVLDSDLCIIVGNFLENAVEACRRQTEGERYIKLNARIQYDTLIIAVENSFNGDGGIKEKDGAFLSSKRDGEGIGISSVRAVALRYGGGVKFQAKDGVFTASAYVVTAEA